MKRVAIYCRVSTALQEQEKTIESQLAELREVCKDFHIVKEYIDDGWSGETLDRPALDQLRNDSMEGLFDAVCVFSICRLSRNLYQQGILVEEFKKRRIEIFIGNKPIENTPEAALLFNMLGAVAQYERTNILERTKRGKLYKARKGIVVGTRAPFGYDYIKKTREKEGYYQINSEKADIVRLIFNLYLELSSICGLTKELTKRRVKPPQGIAWRESSLKRILTDESYIGTTYYNKTQAIEGNSNSKKYRRVVNSRRRRRDKSEWIPIPIHSILSKKLFMTVQELLKKNHRANNQKYPYLLSGGLVKCTECGSTFSGATSHNYSTYRCNNRGSRFPLPQTCKAPQISGKKLEEAVWSSVAKAIMNPRILIRHVRDLKKVSVGEQKRLQNKKCMLIKEREFLKQKKSRLLDIFMEGNVPKEEYLAKIKELNQREKRLDSEVEGFELRLKQTVDRPFFIKDIKYFCNLAKKRLMAFTFQEKEMFLKYLFDRIILDSKRRRVNIIGHIPLESSEVAQVFPVQSAAQYSTF